MVISFCSEFRNKPGAKIAGCELRDAHVCEQARRLRRSTSLNLDKQVRHHLEHLLLFISQQVIRCPSAVFPSRE